MTRLTDEQIDNVVHDVRQALGGKAWYRHFADRIAALAVQEVEREHDARTFELECAKGDIATLTAQLAERTEERDISRSLYREMYEHYDRALTTLRAQLAEARQSIAEEEARADAIATHRDALRAQLAALAHPEGTA